LSVGTPAEIRSMGGNDNLEQAFLNLSGKEEVLEEVAR
jgi:hypothetical protein